MPVSQVKHEPATDRDVCFAEDFKRAIVLRVNFFLRQLDSKYEDDGGTIIYALDVNLLHRYFRSNDPSSPQLTDFAIFSGPLGPPHELAEDKIGDVITRHIVRSLSSKKLMDGTPLLFLPGHDGEARRLYDRFAHQFKGHVALSKSTRGQLTQLLDRLDRTSAQTRVETVKKLEDELHRLLYKLEKPHEQFVEFNDLLLSRRLVSIRNASQHPVLLSRAREAATAFRKFQDDGRVGEGSTHWWQARLSKEIAARYVQQDKQALAALDTLNRQLADARIRVVLLTTNDRIINTGLKYRPHKYEAGDISRYSFSDLYIRHPRCFFSEAEIIRPQADQHHDSDVTTWLDAFLTEVTGAENNDLIEFRVVARQYTDKVLRNLAKVALQRNPDLHKTFFDRWQSHLSNVSLAHVSTSSEARQALIEKMGRPQISKVEKMQVFENYTRGLTETSWNSFFLTAAQLGYDLIGLSAESTKLPKRNAPMIYLGGMELGQKALSLIYAGVIKGESEILEILSSLENSEDARSRYVATLCYALLFAYADRWAIAKLISQRAIHMAEMAEPPTSYDSVTGREAYYFSAIAERLTAKRKEDLTKSDELVDRAIAALESERRAARKGKITVAVAPTNLRFDTERVSIRTARLLFRAQERRWAVSTDATLIADVQETAKGIRELIASASDAEDTLVRAASMVTLRGNYFSCLILLECANALDSYYLDDLEDHVRGQARALETICLREHGELQLSPLDIFLLAYAASFGEHYDPTVKEIEELYWNFDDAQDRKTYALMPYDTSRYDLIDRLIEKRGRATL